MTWKMRNEMCEMKNGMHGLKNKICEMENEK